MHDLLLSLSRRMAWLGGAVLAALIVLTVVSVSGRLLNGTLHGETAQALAPGLADWLIGVGIGPVFGDVELTEAGIAFAIFAFLPLTQMTGAHAAVDLFASRFPAGLARVLGAVTALVFAGVMVLIAWQLGAGMMSKLRSGETTFLIEFPVWWAYAASLPGAGLAAVVACWLAFAQLTGRVAA